MSLNIGDVFQIADFFCDMIPVVSTISNFVNLIQKCALKILKNFGIEIKNDYHKYLDEQVSFSYCLKHMIPGYGIYSAFFSNNYKQTETV